jgi:hypothetical protein
MKQFARYSLVLLTCLSLAAVSTCRNRPDNDNGGNSDNGGNGGGGSDELPADVQKAVDEVVAEIESASQAVGGAVDALTNVNQTDSSTFGDCPEVIFVRQDNVSTFALTFEAGCSSEYYDNSVSGSISAEFDRNAGSFSAIFDNFMVDGQTTDGELNVSRIADNDIRNWDGTIDISTTGVGSVVGDISFEINILTDTLTISTAALDVTNADDETRSVEADGLVIRPVANGSFIPEAGSITFEVPNVEDIGPDTITIVIEFDANSPIDGTVKVTFGEVTLENYPLGAL